MGEPLKGKKILLGVTGGIAAYKAAYLLRLLRDEGASVRVVMTEAACEFVAPLTFETLSGNKVHIHLLKGEGEDAGQSPVEHITLSQWPDAIVIAPATANTISKLSHGRADDLLSAIVSAYRGTVVLAPAMNDKMWTYEATLENLSVLTNRGIRMVPPGEGKLACGTEGPGRMAEPETILAFIKNIYSGEYRGLRVLVSAGRTEEDLDLVRFISNRSTGKMGFALAAAARDMGAQVTVVAGQVSVPAPPGVRLIRVRTAAEMSRELRAAFAESDALFMAAAVCDFTVGEPLEHKKKARVWSLDLERTEDILASLGRVKGKRFIVGFALETEDIEKNALEKLSEKRCDLIVVNNPGEEGAGFGCDTNSVRIFNAEGEVLSTGLKSKREVAEAILRAARREKAFQKILV